MEPVGFKEQNCIYAKDQSEYLPLPAHRSKNGVVISCWSLNWRERIKIVFTGRIWWAVLTFNKSLQPQYPCVDNPFKKKETDK